MFESVNIKSNKIRKIGYEFVSSRMFIDFEDSDPYHTYCRVPLDVFRSFVSASSVDNFYQRYIEGKYECRKYFAR